MVFMAYWSRKGPCPIWHCLCYRNVAISTIECLATYGHSSFQPKNYVERGLCIKGQWNCTTSSSLLYPILGRSHEIAFVYSTLLVTLRTRYNHLNYIARFNNFLQVQEIELVSYASNKEKFLIFQSQVRGQVLKKLDT